MTNTDNTQNFPSQLKVPNHTGSTTLEHQNMENLQNAQNSNSTHELESDHPQDTQDTKAMIQDLINTNKLTYKKDPSNCII